MGIADITAGIMATTGDITGIEAGIMVTAAIIEVMESRSRILQGTEVPDRQ